MSPVSPSRLFHKLVVRLGAGWSRQPSTAYSWVGLVWVASGRGGV
jgi:hypothetical protein